jgi:hypothetical protein
LGIIDLLFENRAFSGPIFLRETYDTVVAVEPRSINKGNGTQMPLKGRDTL